MLSKVSVLLAVWSVVRTCDDVNTVACGQLDRVMNICTDPCFSNLCPRYCGKCPVKCYHCVSGNQADCTEIEECPNMEYACIHERFLTSNFTVGHKSGCVHQQACSMLYGTACHSAGECRDHRGFCCKSDLCNNDATSQRTGRRGYIETGGNDQRRAANRNDTVCHDIDKSSCEILKNSKTNACSLSCFKHACPRTCGVCVECSSCHHVDRPKDCNMTTVCDPDEKCYTLKTRSTDGTYAYNLGCLHQKGCDTLHESAPHALGRSDSIDITIEGHCCSGNLCNQVKPTACFGKKRRDAVLSRKGRWITWKDCVPPTTAHPYVTLTSLSVSPSPVLFPGNITIGVQGTVHHHFGNDVKMVVHMDKLLLGQWTKVPCSQNFGSCNLDNPCELLSAFVLGNGCPCALLVRGIPCTCPFNPSSIDLPPSVFEIRPVNEYIKFFFQGRIRVKAEMIHNHVIVGCIQVEMDIQRHIEHGFLFP
nr:uncharacterized protein LOC105330228 [Crassostrea gigas]